MKSFAISISLLVATGCCHLPADSGEPGIQVFSKDRYTTVGSVTAGKTYLLTSNGIWRDWFICTDAAGFKSIGVMKIFEKRRRLPSARWFALVGVITQEHAPPESDQASIVGVIDLTPYLGTGKLWTPSANGTLHVFANDVLSKYENNSGSIRFLIVPHISPE